MVIINYTRFKWSHNTDSGFNTLIIENKVILKQKNDLMTCVNSRESYTDGYQRHVTGYVLITICQLTKR